MRHIIMYSGGAGSYEAARQIVEREGPERVLLLFADTRVEDPDLYVFLHQTASLLRAPLLSIAEGRTPWQVFRDVRFIGNTRVDPCSKVLKRDLCDKWLRENADPKDTVIVLGLDWTETHRIDGAQARYKAMGWHTEFPLAEPPLTDKNRILDALRKEGIKIPRLYDMKFAHNNCGGFCVKAGLGHFAQLLEKLPDVYAQNEAEEEKTRQHIGKDNIAVMRDRRKATAGPMTMRQFRERVQAKQIAPDPFDIGGCGCFSQSDEAEEDPFA